MILALGLAQARSDLGALYSVYRILNVNVKNLKTYYLLNIIGMNAIVKVRSQLIRSNLDLISLPIYI